MDINNNSLLGTLKIMLLKGEKGDKGDAGTSGDYSGLTNKPKINNVTLDGNKTGTDLGLPTIAEISLAAYPVGSIYLSVNDNDPAQLFGGTWVRIKDTFLLASGDTYDNESTGGSADAQLIQHTHTFTFEHTHKVGVHTLNVKSDGTINRSVSSNSTIYRGGYGDNNTTVNTLPNESPIGTTNVSGDVASGTGKNMPPYLAVYMWKRTA